MSHDETPLADAMANLRAELRNVLATIPGVNRDSADAMANLRAQLRNVLATIPGVNRAGFPPCPPPPPIDPLAYLERTDVLADVKRAVFVSRVDEERLTEALEAAHIAHLVRVRISPYVEPGTLRHADGVILDLDEALTKLAEQQDGTS